jgi:hypothetical protein
MIGLKPSGFVSHLCIKPVNGQLRDTILSR